MSRSPRWKPDRRGGSSGRDSLERSSDRKRGREASPGPRAKSRDCRASLSPSSRVGSPRHDRYDDSTRRLQRTTGRHEYNRNDDDSNRYAMQRRVARDDVRSRQQANYERPVSGRASLQRHPVEGNRGSAGQAGHDRDRRYNQQRVDTNYSARRDDRQRDDRQRDDRPRDDRPRDDRPRDDRPRDDRPRDDRPRDDRPRDDHRLSPHGSLSGKYAGGSSQHSAARSDEYPNVDRRAPHVTPVNDRSANYSVHTHDRGSKEGSLRGDSAKESGEASGQSSMNRRKHKSRSSRRSGGRRRRSPSSSSMSSSSSTSSSSSDTSSSIDDRRSKRKSSKGASYSRGDKKLSKGSKRRSERRREKSRRRKRRRSSSSSSESSTESSSSSSADRKVSRNRRRTSSKKTKKTSKESKGGGQPVNDLVEEQKKLRECGSKGAVTNQWGKYGTLQECDMWSKRQEFQLWLMEVKEGVMLESLSPFDEKQLFKDYMEDFNTATMPHVKYYNIEAWEAEQRKRGGKDDEEMWGKSAKTGLGLTDEAQRKEEIRQVRDRRKQGVLRDEYMAMKKNSDKVDAMRHQDQLKHKMQSLFKMGRVDEAEKIKALLKPDE